MESSVVAIRLLASGENQSRRTGRWGESRTNSSRRDPELDQCAVGGPVLLVFHQLQPPGRGVRRIRDKGLRGWYAPEDLKGGDRILDQIDGPSGCTTRCSSWCRART
jgi:hypothetical protein